MNMTSTRQLPPILADEEKRKWDAFCQASDRAGIAVPEDSALIDTARRAFLFSDFISGCCTRRPVLLAELLDSGDLKRSYPDGYLAARLTAFLAGVTDETDLMARLRRFRCREMVRIAWRDISGWSPLSEVMTDLTGLADTMLDHAVEILTGWRWCQFESKAAPVDLRPRLVVIGMGKLGAGELNFSSDIDLVFSCSGTDALSKAISSDDFFTRIAQQFIRVIHTSTTDGFVFRVDMNLRPYGNSGPLVMHPDAMEDYFASQGREWERYAWIKARPVAGDPAAGHDLLRRLRPFVFRRYLDYGVYESIREMKAGISTEISRKGAENNIKLGPGGIREIEFFGQVFQLLRGGVIPALQRRSILSVLACLAGENIIADTVADDLSRAYCFLRTVENRLQMARDQQTHQLPGAQDEAGWWRLALAMGFDDVSAFQRALEMHTRKVQDNFEDLLEPDRHSPDTGTSQTPSDPLQAVWHSFNLDLDSAGMAAALTDAGYRDPAGVISLLRHLQTHPATQSLSNEGRKRLDRLIPLILKATGSAERPGQALNRILDLIETIETRSVYLAMLLENPKAIDLLVHLADASPMIVTLLAKHPVLLDELLDPRLLNDPPRRGEMETEIAHRLSMIPADDLEFQIESLCVFKQANTLRVAAADVTGQLPLMNVSDRLTDIAEIILAQVMNLAWEYLVARHGRPASVYQGVALKRGFAVIAYGKLGGLELSYSSDLDLVFLHAGESGQMTDGDRPIDVPQFFARLGQRVIHLLSTRTRAGVLYEIDMRLRPDGGGGVLVTHIDQFDAYQKQTARTWEHQALIKARPVIGEPILMGRFEDIRKQILTKPRDIVLLQDEVITMRDQLRQAHGSTDDAIFDIKQGVGGMIDIEFIVQYLVLRLSPDYPELTEWTDNVRLIQTLIETGIIHDRQAYLLKQAYLSYRMMAHRLSLQEKEAAVDDTRFQARRAAVVHIWQHFFNSTTIRLP